MALLSHILTAKTLARINIETIIGEKTFLFPHPLAYVLSTQRIAKPSYYKKLKKKKKKIYSPFIVCS